MSISQMPSPVTGILCVLVLEVSGEEGGQTSTWNIHPKNERQKSWWEGCGDICGGEQCYPGCSDRPRSGKRYWFGNCSAQRKVVWTSRFASIHSCWLSITSGAVWAFVAPALCIIVVSPCLCEQRGWALWALRPYP